MSGADVLVYALGGVAIASAAVVVFGRNLFRNVLAFTAMLLAAAGLFWALGSEFLAVIQVFVYVGGVVVLLLFGLMMTASEPGAPVLVESRHSLIAAVAAVGLAVMVLPAVAGVAFFGSPAAQPGGSVRAIGLMLLTDYGLAFETIGVVLLAAALAAIVIVRRGEAA